MSESGTSNYAESGRQGYRITVSVKIRRKKSMAHFILFLIGFWIVCGCISIAIAKWLPAGFPHQSIYSALAGFGAVRWYHNRYYQG